MITLNTKSYLTILCELIEKNEEVATVVSGNSMYPFLRGDRDRVCLIKPLKPLKKGDIVLYSRENGDFILHRIRYIRNDEYYMIGDRQKLVEGPIAHSKIHAVVSKVERKGKWIDSKSPVWLFYSVFWIRAVKLRPIVFKTFSALSKVKHHFMHKS